VKRDFGRGEAPKRAVSWVRDKGLDFGFRVWSVEGPVTQFIVQISKVFDSIHAAFHGCLAVTPSERQGDKLYPLTTPIIRQALPNSLKIRLERTPPNPIDVNPITVSMTPSLMPVAIHPMPLNGCASSLRDALMRRWSRQTQTI